MAPFLSLGRALLERGTDVVFAAPPEFADAAAGAGLDFRPVAPTCAPIVAAASASTGAPLKALPQLLRATKILTEETLGELPSIAAGSQMLVATGIAYAAPHVADALAVSRQVVWRTIDSSRASRPSCITGAPEPRQLPPGPACRRWWFLT